MALASGTKVGPYEIVAKIGAGGMGEVYRATDTGLGRDVAIKVLPASWAADSERIARFEREAQTLASLDHPNIAHIYRLEKTDGVHALVLELVEGQTLAERIAAGPLPVDEACGIAIQIARALEAAHEKGIIHRDLKPANVIITPDDVAKVLDFGIAKVLEPRPTAGAADSPTLTRAGSVLGTATYMSPEQARGKVVDRRADIWAFGCVLYEMLTGQPAFGGEDVTVTLARVLEREADMSLLPADLAPAARLAVRLCLRKNVGARLQAIADARLLLDEVRHSAEQAVVPRHTSSRLAWPAAIAFALVSMLLLWSAWRAPPTALEVSPMRFDAVLGRGDSFGPTPAISRDGTRIAYRVAGAGGVSMLATRLLSDAHETVLAGTEGAYNPFFSPDGRRIGYFASGRMMTVPVEGGAPLVIADAALGRIGSWSEDGFIYAELNPFAGIFRVPDQGGRPEPLTFPKQYRHAWPQLLPNGRSVLYTAGLAGLFENGRVEAVSIESGESKTILEGGYMARYVASSLTTGHLLYVRAGVLYAVPFDLDTLETKGDPVQIIDDVASTGALLANAYDVSSTGTLVYASGRLPQRWPIVWNDDAGNVEPLLETARAYYTPRVSPDGTRLAYSVDSDRGQDIFVYDMLRDVTTRVTFTSTANLWPVWSPDGEHIAFTSLTEERAALWWARADGTGEPQLLLERENPVRQITLSPDGGTLAFTEQDPATGSDLWMLPLDVSDPEAPIAGEPVELVKTTRNEGVPAISRDGRWIAYLSDELGPYEVWVRSFPGLEGRWQVSSGGGGYPFWSRADDALFYPVGGRRVFRADYTVEGDRFIVGNPQSWGELALNPAPTGFEQLDLAPDGKRFAALRDVRESAGASGRVGFVLGFFEELRRLAPLRELPPP